jgi:hypothetical protein
LRNCQDKIAYILKKDIKRSKGRVGAFKKEMLFYIDKAPMVKYGILEFFSKYLYHKKRCHQRRNGKTQPVSPTPETKKATEKKEGLMIDG